MNMSHASLYNQQRENSINSTHSRKMKKYIRIMAIAGAVSLTACGAVNNQEEEKNEEIEISSIDGKLPPAQGGEESTLSYSFDKYNDSYKHQGDNAGVVTYAVTNPRNAMLRIAVNSQDRGAPFMITLLGARVADKDKLPASFEKKGIEDKEVMVSVPIEVGDGVFKTVMLTAGTVSFKKLDLKNGVFSGTVLGKAEGALYGKDANALMMEVQERMKDIDPNDEEAMKKALTENARAMQDAQKASEKVIKGDIKIDFSLKTGSMIIAESPKLAK